MEDMESQSLGKLSRFHNLNIFIIMNWYDWLLFKYNLWVQW